MLLKQFGAEHLKLSGLRFLFIELSTFGNGATGQVWVAPTSEGRVCAVLQVLSAQGKVELDASGKESDWCLGAKASESPAIAGRFSVPDDRSTQVIAGRARGAKEVRITFASGVSTVEPVIAGFFLVAANGSRQSATATVTTISSYNALSVRLATATFR
jgi:hypothetical protein